MDLNDIRNRFRRPVTLAALEGAPSPEPIPSEDAYTDALKGSRFVDALRIYRARTGCSLADAKAVLVEQSKSLGIETPWSPKAPEDHSLAKAVAEPTPLIKSIPVFMMGWIAEGKAKKYKGWRLEAFEEGDSYRVTVRWGAVEAAGVVTDPGAPTWGQIQTFTMTRSQMVEKVTNEAATRRSHDYTLAIITGTPPFINLV